MKYIIIAGPQCSGKTTALNFLADQFSEQIHIHEEINQYTLFPNSEMGSIIVDGEMEQKIHSADINKIQSIIPNNKIHIAETDIFHMAYYPLICGEHFYYKGKQDYEKALSRFKVFVIFIDAVPEISFQRRVENYLQRIKKAIQQNKLNGKAAVDFKTTMLNKYQERINKLYPLWIRVYDDIDFAVKKIKINNNHHQKDKFLQDIKTTVHSIIL